MGVTGRGIIPEFGCGTEISRKKTVLRTHVLQDLNVQQHCCENFLQVGSQVIGQCDPAWS